MIRSLISFIFTIFCFLTFISCENATEPDEQTGYADSSYLADPAWLVQNLTNADVLVIDARGLPGDSSGYLAGHIPGAVWAVWQKFASFSSAPTEPGYGVLLSASELSKQLASIGVTSTKTVVVYTDNKMGWGEDGRLAWMLRMAGVSRAKILNGGINFWKDQGNSVATDFVTPTPSSFSITTLDQSFVVSTEYLNNNQSNVVILDSRSRAEYDGDTTSYGPSGHGGWGEKNFGHLPNAVAATFTNVFNADGTLKSQGDLVALFTGYGITSKDAIVVSYCTGGIRSGLLTVALRIAGYSNAKNYDESFWGWTASDLPVETQ